MGEGSMGYRTLRNSYFIIVEAHEGETRPWLFKGTLFLCSSESAFATQQALPGFPQDKFLQRIESWEVVLRALEDARRLGANTVAIDATHNVHKAVFLDDMIGHVRDVIAGKHDFNPNWN